MLKNQDPMLGYSKGTAPLLVLMSSVVSVTVTTPRLDVTKGGIFVVSPKKEVLWRGQLALGGSHSAATTGGGSWR